MTNETKQPKEDRMEYCVLCGKDTGYKWSEPIWNRNYYIEGAGQLCRKCYLKLQAEAVDD